MSQDYKLKFDEMQDNQPTKVADENYATVGYVRNICFSLTDGSRKFLNYAYLVSCDYHPAQGLIVLNFTTDTVSIKGSGLKPLYDGLIHHIPKYIEVINPRYVILSNDDIQVTEIILEKPI